MASAIEGLKELDATLRELRTTVRGKVLRSGVGAAIQPAFDRAQAHVPVGNRAHRTYKGRLVAPGFASRSLRKRTFASRDGNAASAVIGVLKEAFYALQFIELGTAKIPATPWLEPAMDQTQDAQVLKLRSALKQRIERVRSRKR